MDNQLVIPQGHYQAPVQQSACAYPMQVPSQQYAIPEYTDLVKTILVGTMTFYERGVEAGRQQAVNEYKNNSLPRQSAFIIGAEEAKYNNGNTAENQTAWTVIGKNNGILYAGAYNNHAKYEAQIRDYVGTENAACLDRKDFANLTQAMNALNKYVSGYGQIKPYPNYMNRIKLN